MSLTIEDLKPKNFTIKVRGVELECKPLKLYQTMMLGSIGDTLSNLSKASEEDIEKANREIELVIKETVPSLNDVELDGATTLDIITQMADHSQPSDDKYLKDNNVDLGTSPKVEKAG